MLTDLTLAWSRDGAEKIYVQDRMRERGAELFAWLEQGAHFYVCGDAKRMAKDVERALVDVVAAARRALGRGGGGLCRGAEEGRALPGGCVLIARHRAIRLASEAKQPRGRRETPDFFASLAKTDDQMIR